MNQTSIVPIPLRSNTLGRARSMRRGLLLGGVAGFALFSGSLPLQAQMLSGSTTAKPSSASARDILNRARTQEAAGSVALAAVFYREALAVAPRDASVARELARFYSRQNRLEEAAVAWKNVLQLRAGDPEATRELTTISSQLPATSKTEKTGVANVSPLPPVVGSNFQTRALAQARASAASPISTRSGASSSGSVKMGSAPVLAPLPPSKNVSATPFTLPARRTVRVSDKRRIAAFAYVNRAAKFLENKQTEQALAEYQRGEQTDPSNAYATPGVAISQVILKRFAEAADTYRGYLSIAPSEAMLPTLRGLADALTYDRQYQKALGVNSYILSHYPAISDPKSGQLSAKQFKAAKESAQERKNQRFAAFYQNAQVYTYVGDYTKANSAFQSALTIDSNRADAWVTWGEVLSYRRDPAAVQASNNALTLYRIQKNADGIARANLALGNYYLYSGQFKLAIPRLRAVTQTQPDNVAAFISLGDAFTYAGQPADALGPYSNALAQKPKEPEYTRAAIGKGRALVYVGRYTEGAQILNAIVAADPKNVQALEALAIARTRTGSKNATDTYRDLLALQKDDASRARVYASIGDTQLKANDLPAATQSYGQAARLAPANADINLTYAQLLYYNNQPTEAASAARRVLALPGNANNAQANAVLLQASLQNGDSATANQIATQFQNASPTTAKASLALALALRGVGNEEAANRLLALAAGQKPDRDTKLRIAAATRDAGDYPASIALYDQLVKEQPTDASARLGYVKSLFWSGDNSNLPLAQTQVQSLLILTPKTADQQKEYEEAQILGAQIGLKLGTPEARDDAVRLANAVLVRDPSNADARTILGQVLVSLQRYPEAVEQLQAAVDQVNREYQGKPSDTEVASRLAEARLRLARAFYYKGDTEGAVAQYRELNTLAPSDTVPRLELARILLDNSRYAEAEALYNEVLVLRRTAMLSPGVRRAIAANSLPRLSALALQGSPVVRSVALIKPRVAGTKQGAPKQKSLASGKRVLLAQNPTVSGPTPPTTVGDLGAGVNPTPETGAPTTETPTTDVPTTAPPTTDTPTVAPPTTDTPTVAPPTTDTPTVAPPTTDTPTVAPPTTDDPVVAPPTTPTQPGGTETPAVPVPQQPQPGTTTPTPPVTPGAGTTSGLGNTLIDSPSDRSGTDIQRTALRGLGESRLRQGQFEDARNYYSQALGLLDTDYEARIGVARALRGLRQFPDALQQVQQVLAVPEQSANVGARVLQAQLLADTGQRDQAQTELNTLIGGLSNTSPLENYVQISIALNSVGNYPASLEVLGRAAQLYPTDTSVTRLRAETLRSSGQADEALALYDQLLSANANDVDAALGKARTYNYTNRLAEAETAYQQVLSISSGNVTAQRELAAVYTRRGNFDGALPLYNQILSANPDDLDALLGRARAYNYSNRLPEAEADYRLLLTKANNVGAQAELADILGRNGNYTESISLFNTAIAADPANLTARINLARVQRRAGQSADAETTLNAVLEADPNSVDALIERGLIRGNNGSYAAGIADLNRAQTLAPDNQAVQLGLAQLQLYSGNYVESINTYQAYLTRNPNDTRARVELAQALSYANRTPEALAEVDTVLKAVPDDVRAKLVQADIYARTNRAPEAINIYNELLTKDPSNAQARIGLGDALLYSQRYTEAVTNYDELLKTDPNNVSIQISRARALSYAGRFKEANAALRTIVTADPNNVQARLALAEVGANSGSATYQRDAIGEYRAILKDNPDNLTAQLGLARVLSYRGEYAESASIARKILATNPGNNDARLVLADAQQYSGDPFGARQNYNIIAQSSGVSSTILSGANAGLGNVSRATSPSIGVTGNYYSDTNGVRLRSIGESAILRTRALTIGVLAEQGKFRQNNLAERSRRNIGILLARQFGPFAAQLIVSRLKYSGVSEKTLFNLSLNRDFSPRKRINLSLVRRDIAESDLAVGRGITATTVNLTSSIPLGKRFDFDATGTYYDYSDNNNRITLSPALMFRFRPTNPSLRIGLGYIYDNTDEARNAPFVYYTPQNFNAAAILADYIVTTGKTRYGISGAVPLTGSTGQNNINRPADTLFGFFERSLGDRFDLNIRGGIVRVPNGSFRSNQVSGTLNYYF